MSGRAYGQLNDIAFEQLDSLMSVEKRHVIVHIHTSWCKHCLRMQETTFKNKEVQHQLNKFFYFLKIDAEGKEDIRFRGRNFKYRQVYRVHELAEALGTVDGELSYPTLCLLNPQYEIVYQHNGFLSHTELLTLLKALKQDEGQASRK